MRKYDDLIQELAEIEMSESTHEYAKENFESKEEFYLESVIIDSYVTDYLESFLEEDEKNYYDLYDIQIDVIEYIKSNCK